jgi:hypothetical protein
MCCHMSHVFKVSCRELSIKKIRGDRALKKGIVKIITKDKSYM